MHQVCGIGAVLMQEGHPIAYLSKASSSKHQALSTYEKELIAVVLAIEKWRPYLPRRHLIIKTDHFSLKYILGQKITTPFQSKWLPKLMGFDYEIVYMQGKENASTNSPSRLPVMQLLTMGTSTMTIDLMEQVKGSWEGDAHLQHLIQQLSIGQSHSKYYWAASQEG